MTEQRGTRQRGNGPTGGRSSTGDEMDPIALNPYAITATADRLAERVKARFPDASLTDQADSLTALARRAHVRADEIARPILWIRGLYVVLALAVVIGLAAAPINFETRSEDRDLFDWIEIIEAGINDIVLLGAGLVFLMTVEGRIKRRRTLEELHQVRSLAHVIDMHQLTKDPHRVLGAPRDADGSPLEPEHTPYQLSRYFDYCSEMLAISGKVAALYVQQFDDQVALETVTEIENLTTGLSRKVWQKMMVLLEVHPNAFNPDAVKAAASPTGESGGESAEPT